MYKYVHTHTHILFSGLWMDTWIEFWFFTHTYICVLSCQLFWPMGMFGFRTELPDYPHICFGYSGKNLCKFLKGLITAAQCGTMFPTALPRFDFKVASPRLVASQAERELSLPFLFCLLKNGFILFPEVFMQKWM